MRRLVLFVTFLLFAGAAAAEDSTTRLGGDVGITEKVEGSLRVAAGQIRVDAPVQGDASLAGGSITVTGAVRDNLRAAGGHVLINGPVGGNASVVAGTLELGPLARIAGKLSFRGGDLKQDPAAVVSGAIEQHAERTWARHERGPFSHYTHGWFWTIGLLVLAGLLAAALPGPSQRMAQELRERPWVTTLVGLVALVTIPVAAVMLMITVIGIPIGLLAIAGYAALLLVGYVWLAAVVGGLLLDRVDPGHATLAVWRAGAAMLAMLALAVLARLPFVGGLFGFVALVAGVGMIVTVLTRRHAPAAGAEPA